jgi:hypothetical protein
MAVVINEFEVIAEPAPATRAATMPEGADPEPAAIWTAHDVEQIVRRQREREARVRAD